ncbi:MAG TPA: NAD(P)H-dependent oxidoreductase subunit E [bacterium]|nr:NAD(P)H-dependent oxidoreductase subunit E [bacterium]
MSVREVDEIIRDYDCQKSSLIAILQDIQAEYRHLPEDAIRSVSQMLDVPLSEVYSVATFFTSFSLQPRKRPIWVCTGTACHVRGAGRILEEIQRRVEGSEELKEEFSVETVHCLGACALAPVLVVDDEYHGRMSIGKVNEIFPQDAAK